MVARCGERRSKALKTGCFGVILGSFKAFSSEKRQFPFRVLKGLSGFVLVF
jgi:hypothetical protein